MAGTRTSDISPDLVENLVDEFFNQALASERKLQYTQLVTEVTRPAKTGTYLQLGALGPAEEKMEAQSYNFDRIQQAYKTTLTVSTRGKAVEASLESMDDDLYGIVDESFGTPLVDRIVQLREKLVADAYNAIFTATGADGVALASTLHPLYNNALVFNDNLATGSLSAANIKAAKLKFMWIRDQAGEFFETEPTTIVIHPMKTYYIIELLESNLMAMETTNTINSVQKYMPTQIVTNKRLTYNTTTGVSPWHVLDKGLTRAGCVLQWQKALQLKTWWENNNDVYRARARERYAVGFRAPGYGIVSSAGTD